MEDSTTHTRRSQAAATTSPEHATGHSMSPETRDPNGARAQGVEDRAGGRADRARRRVRINERNGNQRSCGPWRRGLRSELRRRLP
jgi:hypothetical protein